MSVESRQHLWMLDRELAKEQARTFTVFPQAARAEAAYKKAFAKTALRYRAEGMPVSAAELEAQADPEIADLLEHRLVTAAERDALAEWLRVQRQRCANGQTFITDEREADHAHGRSST